MSVSEDKLTRSWYSETYVDKIIVPSLTSWRSRYDLKEELLLSNGRLVKRNMRQNDIIPVSTSEDMEHIVSAAEHNRPDIIAYNMYGDARLAWVILAANGLNDMFELETNMQIIIPSATSLYQTGGVLAK
jgi:hypothetical protein